MQRVESIYRRYIRPHCGCPLKVVDRRLFEMAHAFGNTNLIQEGYGELNFILIKELNRNWQVTAKAKNILDARSEITQGSLLTNGFNLGREASIQVQYRF